MYTSMAAGGEGNRVRRDVARGHALVKSCTMLQVCDAAVHLACLHDVVACRHCNKAQFSQLLTRVQLTPASATYVSHPRPPGIIGKCCFWFAHKVHVPVLNTMQYAGLHTPTSQYKAGKLSCHKASHGIAQLQSSAHPITARHSGRLKAAFVPGHHTINNRHNIQLQARCLGASCCLHC